MLRKKKLITSSLSTKLTIMSEQKVSSQAEMSGHYRSNASRNLTHLSILMHSTVLQRQFCLWINLRNCMMHILCCALRDLPVDTA